MTRAKKIIIAAACAVALLLVGCFALLWRLYGNPAPDSPAMEAYGLPDYGIVGYGRDVEVTKANLRFWLSQSCRGEQLAQSPRFQYLLNRPGNKVTLTPNDQLMMFIYDYSEEAVADTIEHYADSAIVLAYEPRGDDGYYFGNVTCDAPPTEEEIAEVLGICDCGCEGGCSCGCG